MVDRLKFTIGTVPFTSTTSIQLAAGVEELPFDRGRLDRFRGQPTFTGKWLLEFNPWPAIYANVRVHYLSNWITRSVILPGLEELLTAPDYYVIDLQLRYSFSKGKEVYVMANNITNNAFYGIGASGGAGIIGSGVIFEDIVLNPQLLRLIKVGVRLSI